MISNQSIAGWVGEPQEVACDKQFYWLEKLIYAPMGTDSY